MKWALFLSVLTAGIAQAAPRVNSGGGGWACRKADGSGEVLWVKAADLTKVEFYKPARLAEKEGDVWDLLKEQQQFIQRVLPNLAKILNDNPFDISSRLRAVSEALNFIPDAELRYKPPMTSCPGGVVSYVQLADTTIDGNVIYSSRVWSLPTFSNFQKAAILLHEQIYFALRQTFGDASSYRTRQIMGLLYAGMADEVLRGGVDEVLADKARARQGIFGFNNGPALFNVQTKCRISIDSDSSVFNWSPTAQDGVLTLSKNGYAFTVLTNLVDGSPVSLQIKDERTGITTGVAGEDAVTVFNAVRKLSVQLQHGTNMGASLICESNSELDLDPL